MNKYELMYIIDVALEEAARKELIERVSTLITSNGGEVEKVDEWGKRRLAYSINYKNEGYYVLVNFTAGADLPREIERVLQISEDVLRYLIVKIEEKRSSVKPRPVSSRPVYARPSFGSDVPEQGTPNEAGTPVATQAPEAVAEAETADAPVVAEAVAAPAEEVASDEPETVPEA